MTHISQLPVQQDYLCPSASLNTTMPLTSCMSALREALAISHARSSSYTCRGLVSCHSLHNLSSKPPSAAASCNSCRWVNPAQPLLLQKVSQSQTNGERCSQAAVEHYGSGGQAELFHLSIPDPAEQQGEAEAGTGDCDLCSRAQLQRRGMGMAQQVR